jgi:ABC-type transporter Mla subunit MlaD
VAIVFLAIASLIGYRAAETVPGRQYYNLQAEFTEADNLSNHYEVRVQGLRAGQILHPRVRDGKALVDVRLDKKFAPLRSDSKLQVRLRSAVGVRYLEIIPGRKGRPLKEGELLPTENQRANVSLDQTLGTLDPTTRAKAQGFLTELGAGTEDNGQDINVALKRLSPFLRDVQTLAEPLNARAGITAAFIRNSAAGVGAFDATRDTLAATFDPAERALKPFADDADEIGETLDEATPTLNQLGRQLPQVDRLVAAVDGLARDGRPALQQAPAALRETTRLMRGSRPALRQARTTLDLAREAVDPTIAVLQTLQPQLGRIDAPIDSLRPILNQLGEHACAIPNAFTTWANWLKWGTAKNTGIRFYLAVNIADELSGGSDKRLPGPDGKSILANNIHVNPYPAPCDGGDNSANGASESGRNLPVTEESAKGLDYSVKFPVIR